MKKPSKTTLTIVAVLAVIFLITNPTNKDFEEKVATLSEFNQYIKTGDDCLIYGRKENYLFFSVFEVTNNCYWDKYREKIKRVQNPDAKRPTKRFIGFLKTFRHTY
jgi:hypothetical protein